MAKRLILDSIDLLVTVDSDNRVLKDSAIAIEDGLIVEIAEAGSLQGGDTVDLSGHLLAPGLINCHTHLAMTLLRGWAEGVDLQGFLERVWAAEGAIMDPATCELGTELGALEALLSGTTTALDMYFNPESTHRGAVKVGLRHIAGPIFFDFPGLDGMEWRERIEYARSWPERVAAIGGPSVPLYLTALIPIPRNTLQMWFKSPMRSMLRSIFMSLRMPPRMPMSSHATRRLRSKSFNPLGSSLATPFTVMVSTLVIMI
jgi:5-methylthioadenosine/S-adenosylhomocysteine deaminase